MADNVISKQRIEEIDIIKAIAIILMVVGHGGAPFTQFVYLFHMAVFFIASGYTFRTDNSDSVLSVKRFIQRKFGQLWVPFFLWNALFTLLHNVFVKVNVYTDNSAILDYVKGNYIGATDYLDVPQMITNIVIGLWFSSDEQMCGAFWFLKILFCISVGYCILEFIFNKFKYDLKIIQTIISIVFLFIGYMFSLKQNIFHGLAQVLSYYCLFHLGRLLGEKRYRIACWKGKEHVATIAISVSALFACNNIGTISLASNSYKNPLFLLVTSFYGWCLLYSISYFVKKIEWLRYMLLVIGKRTLSIVEMHFLAFKLVALVVTYVYGLPRFCIAAFPNLYGDRGLWWIAYTIVVNTHP